MQTHGRAAGQAGVLQPVGHVQLIQSVAALVNHRVQVAGHVVLVVVGGNAHVALVELGGEGVLALAQHAVPLVDAHQLHYSGREHLLGLNGPGAFQEIAGDLRTPLADLLHQRLDHCLQLVEEGVALGHGQALLVLVQPHVVGGLIGIEVGGGAAAVGHDLLQIGGKQREVAGGLGLLPGVHRGGGQLHEGGVFLGGNLAGLVVHPLQLGHLGGLLLGALLAAGLLQQSGQSRVGDQAVFDAAQHLQRLAPAGIALAGGHGLGVEVDHIQRKLKGVQLLLQVPQGLHGFGHHKNGHSFVGKNRPRPARLAAAPERRGFFCYYTGWRSKIQTFREKPDAPG